MNPNWKSKKQTFGRTGALNGERVAEARRIAAKLKLHLIRPADAVDVEVVVC